MSRSANAHRRRDRVIGFIALAFLLSSLSPSQGADSEPELQAQASAGEDPTAERAGPVILPRPAVRPEELRERVVEAGGLLAEQGYRLRRDTWHGQLQPEIRVRIPVFLFEGNDYRFIIATDGPLRELLISLVDQDGNPQPHRSEFGGPPHTRAVSFAPQKSGIFYVQLGISVEGTVHQTCLGFVFR